MPLIQEEEERLPPQSMTSMINMIQEEAENLKLIGYLATLIQISMTGDPTRKGKLKKKEKWKTDEGEKKKKEDWKRNVNGNEDHQRSMRGQ